MNRIVTIIALSVLIAPGMACASGEKNLPQGALVDRIVVEKAARRLTLMKGGSAVKSYKVALGRNPTGDKTRQGDNRTPEGIYKIDRRNDGSLYHRALHLSYPNPGQVERARKLGVDPGGDIMIHGLPPAWAWAGSLHRQFDWTRGCIAVTNAEIDEIWRVAPIGTTVEIKP